MHVVLIEAFESSFHTRYLLQTDVIEEASAPNVQPFFYLSTLLSKQFELKLSNSSCNAMLLPPLYRLDDIPIAAFVILFWSDSKNSRGLEALPWFFTYHNTSFVHCNQPISHVYTNLVYLYYYCY